MSPSRRRRRWSHGKSADQSRRERRTAFFFIVSSASRRRRRLVASECAHEQPGRSGGGSVRSESVPPAHAHPLLREVPRTLAEGEREAEAGREPPKVPVQFWVVSPQRRSLQPSLASFTASAPPPRQHSLKALAQLCRAQAAHRADEAAHLHDFLHARIARARISGIAQRLAITAL